MKTKNAFAFQDFDAERILQRPYLRALSLPVSSDAEILESLKATDEDSIEITQEKIDSLAALSVSVLNYQDHIKRHGARLAKYSLAVANKIATDISADILILRNSHKRAVELSVKYYGRGLDENGETIFFAGTKFFHIVVEDIGDLLKKILAELRTLEEKRRNYYRKIFGTRLRQVRKEMKLTQAGLAERLNISQRAVGNYEQSTREPSIEMLVMMSKELKRPVDWLIGAI